MNVLKNTTALALTMCLQYADTEGTAVDATCGNGHDTLWLAERFARVYGFDIQESAIESTRARLKEEGVENVELIHDSHAKMADYIKERPRVIVFNLGYLPGGDKSITTLRETTLPAIRDAISLMDKDAILNIAVYPGHKEGDAEGQMILDYLAGISRHRVCATLVKIVNSPTSPFFIVVETKP